MDDPNFHLLIWLVAVGSALTTGLVGTVAWRNTRTLGIVARRSIRVLGPLAALTPR